MVAAHDTTCCPCMMMLLNTSSQIIFTKLVVKENNLQTPIVYWD